VADERKILAEISLSRDTTGIGADEGLRMEDSYFCSELVAAAY
jgi:hypothetical protein